MKFYEHTIIAKQDLSAKDLEAIKNKYEGVINSSSGKVLKTENWGLLNFVRRIITKVILYIINFKVKIVLLMRSKKIPKLICLY